MLIRSALGAADKRRIQAMLFANNGGSGLRQALLDGAPFLAELTHTAVPTRGSIVPTFTRATTETGQKWDEAGYLDFTALAGEIVFKGARRERNLIPAARTSEDLTLWDKSGITVSANQYVAPNGATTMDKILASAGNSQHILLNGATAPIAYSAGPHLLQCYLRYDNHRYVYIALNDGTNVPVVTVDLLNGVIANTTASTTAYIEEVEAGVYLVGLFRTMVAFANGSAYIGLNNTGAASAETWNAAGTEAIGCWGVALYNITGETDQTTIRPYVSVGAVQRNLLKQSNKFDDTTVWGTEGASPLSFTQNLPAPTGINCDAGWTVTDNSDVNFEASSQILALTLAGYTATHYVAKTTGAQSSYPILYYYTSTGNVIAIATVDTSNGIATAWTAYTGFTIASGFTATCTSHDSIYWKVVLNFTATAASWKSAFGAAGTATANKSSGTLSEGSLTGSAGFAGAMLTLATADQTYQAVGGTYPYHGSGVDGVKCFDTDLSGNPIPTSYTYDAVTLNGVAGTYVSTPSSTATQIAGDKTIILEGLSLSDIAPTSYKSLASTFDATAALGYSLFQDQTTPGKLVYFHRIGGLTYSPVSSVTLASAGIAASTPFDLAVTHDTAGTVKFWYDIGAGWVQLGADVATQAGNTTGLTSPFSIMGVADVPASYNNAGSVERVRLYSGVVTDLDAGTGGTLAVDFDASRYAGGTTLTGSTGETWTLNGSAVIHPTNYPLVGYVPWEARTNVTVQSNTIGTAPWASAGSCSVAQNVVGVNGTVSAWTIQDTDATIASYRQQTQTLTAATYTQQCKVKKTTGAQSTYPVFFAYSGAAAKIASCTIDTTNGVATIWTAFTGLTIPTSSCRCTDYSDEFWLVELTFLATAQLWEVCGYSPVAASSPTLASGAYVGTNLGSSVAQDFMCELGSFATPYTPTTTVAVARNADVLTYTGGDIPNLKTLMAGFRRESGVSIAGHICTLTDGTANNTAQTYLNTATQHGMAGVTGGVVQWGGNSSNAYTPATRGKNAISVATNDAKSSFNGVGQAADASVTVPVVTQMCVGHFNTSLQLNGNVGGIYGWTRNLSQSELNAVTA